MQGKDPKSIIDHGAMSVGQWLAVLVTVGLNAMDGFDVLSISFASPGIAKDWGVDKATLGWVLSMELVGMAMGSVLLGGVAWLAQVYHIGATDPGDPGYQSMLSQLLGAVTGRGLSACEDALLMVRR